MLKFRRVFIRELTVDLSKKGLKNKKASLVLRNFQYKIGKVDVIFIKFDVFLSEIGVVFYKITELFQFL